MRVFNVDVVQFVERPKSFGLHIYKGALAPTCSLLKKQMNSTLLWGLRNCNWYIIFWISIVLSWFWIYCTSSEVCLGFIKAFYDSLFNLLYNCQLRLKVINAVLVFIWNRNSNFAFGCLIFDLLLPQSVNFILHFVCELLLLNYKFAQMVVCWVNVVKFILQLFILAFKRNNCPLCILHLVMLLLKNIIYELRNLSLLSFGVVSVNVTLPCFKWCQLVLNLMYFF